MSDAIAPLVPFVIVMGVPAVVMLLVLGLTSFAEWWQFRSSLDDPRAWAEYSKRYRAAQKRNR